MAAETSSAAAGQSAVVGTAAAALTVLTIEPTPRSSVAAAANSSGATDKYHIATSPTHRTTYVERSAN